MSASIESAPQLGFVTRRQVKVRRSGNSSVLPIPAEIGRAEHIELGAEYTLEVTEAGLLYRRSDGPIEFIGEGSSKVGVVPSSRVMAAPQRSDAAPLDDWDF